MRFFTRFIRSSPEFHGGKFFALVNGKRLATPLFAALVMIEATDLIFAVDSIPAILAISSDTFIVYTSNVFAILGLRSLYFAVAGLMQLFHYLKFGLAAILVFVGAKMMLTDLYKLPVLVALGGVLFILLASVGASLLWPKPPEARSPLEREAEKLVP